MNDLIELITFILSNWLFPSVLALLLAAYLVVQHICIWWKTHQQAIQPTTAKRHVQLFLLLKLMFFIWSIGWVCYTCALWYGKDGQHQQIDSTPLELLLRSAICSANLFFANIDSNVFDNIVGEAWLRGVLSGCAFLAVLTTVALFISLIYSRVRAYCQLYLKKINNGNNHLYVFFSTSEKSLLLASDVLGAKGDKQATVVFVECNTTSAVDRNHDVISPWQRFSQLFVYPRADESKFPKSERVLNTVADCHIHQLEYGTTNVWESAGLNRLKQLIAKLNKAKDADDSRINLFFLDDCEEENLCAARLMASDETLRSIKVETHIFCSAQLNPLSVAIEHIKTKPQHVHVHILDVARLSIETLKRNVENQPISFVDIDTTESNIGQVKSKFTSLIVGFGSTGQYAADMLYEYGAFVDAGSTEKKTHRSPFQCIVVDKDIANLKGSYLVNRPAIEQQPEPLIAFHEYDCLVEDFYHEVLEPMVAELNYVVVAIGDEKQNIAVALDILDFVKTRREDMNHFHIYIRAFGQNETKHLENILLYHNQQHKAEILRLFGKDEEIFTYELIVSEYFRNQGKRYYDQYRKLKLDNSSGQDWDERHHAIWTPGQTPAWYEANGLQRKEIQDLSNALHASTKIEIIRRCVGDVQAFSQRVLQKMRLDNRNFYFDALSQQDRQLIIHLAMLEHIRWNASHEMLGYVSNMDTYKCDEKTKRHHCLIPWEQLDEISSKVDYGGEDFKRYDYGVVITTLQMYLEDIRPQAEG